MKYSEIVVIRAIESRICELEELHKTLGVDYDCEMNALESILDLLKGGAKIVSRETMCNSVIRWFQSGYDKEW